LYTKIAPVTAPNVLEMEVCREAHTWMTQNRPVATVRVKWEEDGGLEACPHKNFSRPYPLEHQKMSFRNLGEHCCHHSSLSSEGN